MCAVIQHILARGPAARPRCIPPACGVRFGIEPRHTSETDRRFITRNVCPLHCHKREPPRSPLNPMDGRDFRSPHAPSTRREMSLSLHGLPIDQPGAGWICDISIRACIRLNWHGLGSRKWPTRSPPIKVFSLVSKPLLTERLFWLNDNKLQQFSFTVLVKLHLALLPIKPVKEVSWLKIVFAY